jgi:hypothetical protein
MVEIPEPLSCRELLPFAPWLCPHTSNEHSVQLVVHYVYIWHAEDARHKLVAATVRKHYKT